LLLAAFCVLRQSLFGCCSGGILHPAIRLVLYEENDTKSVMRNCPLFASVSQHLAQMQFLLPPTIQQQNQQQLVILSVQGRAEEKGVG
jgi:hypothetical protein